MIVKVCKSGKDAAGFTRYLFGPGKANEHTNPRMVAGSPELMGEWSGQALTMREATHLGRVVEASWRRQYAPEVAMAGVGAGGVSRSSLHSQIDQQLALSLPDGAVRPELRPQQPHVVHVVISLSEGEGTYTDEQWHEVATKYMDAMGFTGQEGRPDASWYAVNHGLSEKGNDHLHIVACSVRRDGTTLDLHRSGYRSQDVRREVLEKLDFVAQVHQPAAENAPTLGDFTAAEHGIARGRAAAGRGSATPDRVQLQRILRAAAAASDTEAGFINNVIANRGLEVVAARWAPGPEKEIVTGYKVRFKDGHWFSASTLAPDLSLSKLRKGWSGETDESRSYARALWAEKAAGERRTPTLDAPAQLERAAAELQHVNDGLAVLDPRDVAAWNHVEAATAGATAVLATALPRDVDEQGRDVAGFPVDAGRASDVLTRQWLADNHNLGPAGRVPAPPVLSRMELATRHLQLAIRATSTDRFRGWLAVVQQLARTMQAIAEAKRARNELIAASTLSREAVGAMNRLEQWLEVRVDQTPTATDVPELSEAAKAARAASGHATVDRPETPLATPAAGTEPDGAHAATVDRSARQARGRGPRSS